MKTEVVSKQRPVRNSLPRPILIGTDEIRHSQDRSNQRSVGMFPADRLSEASEQSFAEGQIVNYLEVVEQGRDSVTGRRSVHYGKVVFHATIRIM